MTYPIKVVSKLTGLGIHAIRAWEKRYKAVVPQRTETNRRVYSESDLAKLKLLKKALENGYSIGSIANFSISELENIVGEAQIKSLPEKITISPDSIGSHDKLEACIASVKKLDARGLEKDLYNALAELSQPQFINEIIAPLLEEIGKMWEEGEIRIVNENISSSVIRKVLYNLIDNNIVPEYAPKILIASPTGQHHELGALITGLIASTYGWHTTYIGPNLSAEEIAAAAIKLDPKIIALSIVYPADNFTLDKEIAKLTKLLGNSHKIIAGGRSVNSYRSILESMNVKIVNSIEEFKAELEKRRLIAPIDD